MLLSATSHMELSAMSHVEPLAMLSAISLMWRNSFQLAVETNSEIIAAAHKNSFWVSRGNFQLIAALKSQSRTSSLTSCDISGGSCHKETRKGPAPSFMRY